MKKAIVILCALILLPTLASAGTFDMSPEMLFEKALEYALEMGAMPTEIDKIKKTFITYPASFEPGQSVRHPGCSGQANQDWSGLYNPGNPCRKRTLYDSGQGGYRRIHR